MQIERIYINLDATLQIGSNLNAAQISHGTGAAKPRTPLEARGLDRRRARLGRLRGRPAVRLILHLRARACHTPAVSKQVCGPT